jgi:hypothetical protein
MSKLYRGVAEVEPQFLWLKKQPTSTSFPGMAVYVKKLKSADWGIDGSQN